MNGFFGGGYVPQQPMGYMPPAPIHIPYAPTRQPPFEVGFIPDYWAYMVGKVRGRTYSDAEWKFIVEGLAKCDAADYFMEVKGVSMNSHVWFKDSYFLNKMMATQSAYDPDHPISRLNVEIKSQFHEMALNVPELEIRYVKDRNTPDVIYDTLSHHFISGGVIHSIRIGERQPQEHTMTVFVRFFSIETYLEAFLAHIKNLKQWIDPTNVRIKGIPAGGRRLFDRICEYIQGKWGKIYDTKFKDRPEGCDCYVRVPLPAIAEDIRKFDWRDPDVPVEFRDVTTNAPSYALWGSSGKPPGAFVDKSLNGYMKFEDVQNVKLQLQHRLTMQLQHMPHPVYNPVQPQMQMGNVNGFGPMGNGMPAVGNATPFPNMAGNATPFATMAGNATPWNSFNTYAATPFSSFTLDNQASTALDPRFPPPPPGGGSPPPPPPPNNMMVDQAFSKRANANFKKAPAGARSSYASRGRSGRGAPVFAGSRRGSRSTNDGNDFIDSPAGEGDTDIYETSSQKSGHSNKSSTKNGSKKQQKIPPKAPRSHKANVSNSDPPARIYELFPREEEEDEFANFRKAHKNSVCWNSSPEHIKRREELDRIIQENIERRAANRREKYEMLNELPVSGQDAVQTDRAVAVNGHAVS